MARRRDARPAGVSVEGHDRASGGAAGGGDAAGGGGGGDGAEYMQATLLSLEQGWQTREQDMAQGAAMQRLHGEQARYLIITLGPGHAAIAW